MRTTLRHNESFTSQDLLATHNYEQGLGAINIIRFDEAMKQL